MLDTLLKAGALSGGARFVGVDTDPDTIEGCRSRFGPAAPAVWLNSSLRAVLTLKKHAELRERVGVLVYDSHDALHDSKLARNLRPLFDFATRQQARLGEFLLILNVTADPRYTRPSHRQRYAAILSEQVEAPVTVDHQYRSKVTPMIWTALRYGF